MITGVTVFDNVLKNPEAFRELALKLQYRTYEFEGPIVFHGIAISPLTEAFIEWIKERFPSIQKNLTFFRRSPLGQVEPNDIHTDIDMGDYSFILYLNPDPPEEDGTCFWTHRATNTIESSVPHERSKEGHHRENWEMRERVQSKFNRAIMFPSSYFHSRAIHENHGEGESARLVQVAFFKKT